jgi:hypothetical protein
VRPTLVRALVVVALAVATSCTKPLDTSHLETTLTQQLEADTGTTGLTVSCPTDAKVQTGGTFQCTATKSGSATLTIDVTQTDDKGNVTWKVAGASTSARPISTASPST